MPYNNVIDRTDVPINDGLMDDILGLDGIQPGAARTLFRNLPVSKKSNRQAVLNSLPTAYWVTGDTGVKQTTEVSWTNKYLTVEELAVIIPVPQNVLDDSDFDIWAECRPLVAEAIDRALDSAVFFGTNAPGTFPTNVQAAATSAGNTVDVASAASAGGIYNDIDDLFGTLEADGFEPTGIAASRTLKGKLRKARNANGDRLDRERVNGSLDEIDGIPIVYTLDGLWPQSATAGVKGTMAFAGDFKSQFVLGIRKDVTYEVFREGVIQDNTGTIIYNLLQQDMVALRVTFRAGWQVANVINRAQPTEGSRYPAAVLRTPALP